MNKNYDVKVDSIRLETSIAWLWKYLGLPGEAARECNSPFRDDKKPSFSVWRTAQGDRWRDHGTNESGDVVDFYCKAKDVSVGVAIGQLHAIRNLSSPPVSKPIEKTTTVWRKPTKEECIALGKLRRIDPASFDLASELGTLRVGKQPSTNELLWWLTDLNGYASEGRTFTGMACQCSGKKVTAFPGSKKDWPVGLKTHNSAYDKLDRIVLVEGSADYYAGLHVAIRVGFNFRVCSMLGANCNICEAARSQFSDTHVLILAHNDDTGQAAAARWKEQLSNASVIVQPLPTGIKDLNDLLLAPLFSYKYTV